MTTRTYTKRHRSGSTTTYVKLNPGEAAVIIKPGQTAVLVSDDAYYKLGGQVGDIVQGHVIGDATRVSWCSFNQQWYEVGEAKPEVVKA